jgi:hypothetical protein
MADDQLDAAVGAALEARARGDSAAMNQAFDVAKQTAEALYPEGDGEPAKVTPSGPGESVSAEVLDTIREVLISTGDTDMADARLASTVESALSFAQSFDRANPELAAEIVDLASTDARIYSLVLKFAAAQGRAAPRQAPAPAPTRARTNPDSSYAPVEPILSHRESIEADIDAMIAQTPPGSFGYTDRRFQKRLQALYSQLDDGPITGRGARWT